MNIHPASIADVPTLAIHDHHISKPELEASIRANRILIAEENGVFVGWLRYNLFWDSIPFMNMLYVSEEYRGKGIGSLIVADWEERMRNAGYKEVMTSTVSEEYAQHFYHKHGYRTIGGFLLRDDPYEIILSKAL